jgi:hypothetical protein
VNNPEFIIWLVPGYVAFLLYRYVHPYRSKQGWEWVFQTSVAALACFFIARLILGLGVFLASYATPSLEAWARVWWALHFPFKYSFTLVLGFFPASVLAALALCVLRVPMSWHKRILAGAFSDSSSGDIFLYTCKELQSEQSLALLTLTSGKVYIGFVTDFSEDPDDPDKFIEIVPTMSGYRETATQKVVYTTAYVDDAEEQESEAVQLLIRMAEVVGLSRFSETLHNRSLLRGTTVMQPFTAPEMESLVLDSEAVAEITPIVEPAQDTPH